MFYWKWGWSTKNPTANCRFISMTPTLEESLQQLFPIYSSHFTIWKIHHECRCISYWMVGIFQLILLVLKGIQFPKKTRRTSGRTKKKKTQNLLMCSWQHMWKQTKNFSFLSVGWWEETVTKRMPRRSKATLQLSSLWWSKFWDAKYRNSTHSLGCSPPQDATPPRAF